MAVNIIDPNDKIINSSGVLNASPDYENMVIYAELTATRRGHTEVALGSNGTTSSSVDSVKVNFMGFDEATQSYTTNWTENTSNSKNITEGFGITSIKVKMNSSYIPQVDIEFVDIRGMCLFNTNNPDSPYRMIFDFPSSLFSLKIKGYYGKMLEYKLHFVRQDTKFDGNTGNYTIRAEFISNTFAPLSDILFKYVEMIPLMNKDNSIVNKGKPKNTHELIAKLRTLYDEANNLVKDSPEIKQINLNKEQINSSQEVINNLNSLESYIQTILGDKYKGKIVTLSKVGDVIKPTTASSFSSFTKNDFDALGNRKLLIGIKTNGNYIENSAFTPLSGWAPDNTPVTSNESIYPVKTISNDFKSIGIDLATIKNQLISSANISNSKKAGIKETYVLYTNNIYNCLDISEYYINLIKTANAKRDEIIKNEGVINSKIDEIALRDIGMIPTAYNIFKILCDDVDTMFNILRKTCDSALSHHNNPTNIGKFKSDINNKDIQSDELSGVIQPFPKFMKFGEQIGCRPTSLVKTYPDVNVYGYLPEMEFVDSFINIFLKTKQADIANTIKSQKDDSGNGLWMPISPMDSARGDNPSYQPYSDYLNGSGSITDNVLDIFLNRYYLLTQNIYKSSYYFNGADTKHLTALYSEAEALNISLSITDQKVIDNLLELVKNSNGDFNQLFKNTPSYKTINNPNFIKLGGTEFYKNNKTDQFKGIKIIADGNIETKDIETATDPVSKFIKSNTEYSLVNAFNWNVDDYDGSQVTKDNLVYFGDIAQTEGEIIIYSTQFNNNKSLYIGFNSTSYINLIGGNYSQYMNDFILLSYDGYVYIPNDSKVKDFFSIPSIISLPTSVLAYYGFCCEMIDTTKYDIIIGELNILLAESRNTNNKGLEFYYTRLIDKLEKDVTYFKTLDSNTKLILNDHYNSFDTESIISNVLDLHTEWVDDTTSTRDLNGYNKLKQNGSYYNTITKAMMSSSNIMIYNEIVFNPTNSLILTGSTYTSLNELSKSPIFDKINTTFMSSFMKNLNKYLKKSSDEKAKKVDEFNKSINDNDLKTQIYYSIKNIVDKWINGYDMSINGYPMNNSNLPTLIDHFVFVDRAMNDIGGKPYTSIDGQEIQGSGCVINAQTLTEMTNDNEINIFTVFSRILSQNGFEFFPLQNFMMFSKDKDWEETFALDIRGEVEVSPGFVCMLIGGTSNNLDTGNGYKDDGILDLSKADGFGGNDCGGNETKTNIANGKVNVFKVSFGKQNQSIFKDISFDTKEFPETNESLAILSKLAGDDSSSSPVGKAQNLFKTYENRAYGCKVSMMGNVMMQPTQYFQVENIPMYNGAYILLNVEHTIDKNNSMSTEISGTRILKYPNPIITSFATSVGLQTTTSYIRNVDSNQGGMGIVNPNDINTIPTQMRGESYNTLKI